MRAVVQRVTRASVTIDDAVVSAIGRGMVVLAGVGVDDSAADARSLASKCATLRIFRDNAGVMNRSIGEVNGEVLAVSQFTLHGDVRRGRRPSYIAAAPPERAEPIYDAFVEALRAQGLPVVEGRFQAMMLVELVNDGPVTILLDTKKVF